MKGGSEPIRLFLPPRPLLHSTGGLADPARHPHPQSPRVKRGLSLAPGSKATLPEAPVPSQAHFLAQTQNSWHSSCQGNWGFSHEAAQVTGRPNLTSDRVWKPRGEAGTSPRQPCGLRPELGRHPLPPDTLPS